MSDAEEAGFAAKLDLVLKALSISRGRLAADLGVDKSLVSRWLSGAVRPSGHNLARLSTLIASRREGFSMLAWDRDLGELAMLVGAEGGAVPRSAPQTPVGGRPTDRPANLAMPGRTYHGFWSVLAVSPRTPGRLTQYAAMIMAAEDGSPAIRLGNKDFFLVGTLNLSAGLVAATLTDQFDGTPYYLVCHGAPGPRPGAFDGYAVGMARDHTRTLAAVPILFQRIGMLSGDEGADDALWRELGERALYPDLDSIPARVRARLLNLTDGAEPRAREDAVLRLPLADSMVDGYWRG